MKPVRYTDRAYSKIQQWVQLCPKEISGYGTVKIVDDHFVVTDAFLLEQEVTSVTTEIDALATAHLMDELSDREEELRSEERRVGKGGGSRRGTCAETGRDEQVM